MDAVTYPSEDVVTFITDHLIPLRIDINEKSFYEKYHLMWTPTTLFIDYQGDEIAREVGFFEPNQFIPMLQLGLAKFRYNNKEHDAAEVLLRRLIDKFPDSDVVPEASYFRGVNLYKMKNDPAELKKAYEKLLADWPESSWAKRAAPYRLL